MLLCWSKQLNVVVFWFSPVPAPPKPVAEDTLPFWNVTFLPFYIFTSVQSMLSYFPRFNTHVCNFLPLFSQIPLTQSTVMDDVEKWLALDDEVNP